MTHIINARNVCEALDQGMRHLMREGIKSSSRNGDVLTAPGPVITCTQRPGERVLFSALRDANPFFHLYEALWMLAGERSVERLAHYAKNFQNYAEPNGEIHGAYGYRWRRGLGLDQLEAIVRRLREDPASRQCVLQMWHVAGWANDLMGNWRDRPCNTHAYFRVRGDGESRMLDLTVCCRSNDMLWGCHGANAVHFSVLLEYVAARVGLPMGRMYQLSNDYHIYVEAKDRLLSRGGERTLSLLSDNRYFASPTMQTRLMFDVPEFIDRDLIAFLEWERTPKRAVLGYANSWFADVASPALRAHHLHRAGALYMDVNDALAGIRADDWCIACTEWIERRRK